MRDALRRAAPILATAALLLVAVGLLTPSVPLRAAAEGHDPLALGILGSAYFAGFVAGCLAAPPVIAGLGFRPAYGVLAAIAAALAAALLATGDEAAWLGLRAAGGFALAALYVAIEGALNAEAD
ncbi:MAG: MFS transporter, partial [Alphaproteobacteria bacterium]|nr:MFS transporter [Alphaproteobacteria bacterium]